MPPPCIGSRRFPPPSSSSTGERGADRRLNTTRHDKDPLQGSLPPLHFESRHDFSSSCMPVCPSLRTPPPPFQGVLENAFRFHSFLSPAFLHWIRCVTRQNPLPLFFTFPRREKEKRTFYPGTKRNGFEERGGKGAFGKVEQELSTPLSLLCFTEHAKRGGDCGE